MTKDLKTVTVGALVTYVVDDIVSALVKIADLPSDIIERSQGAILAEVGKRTLEDIQAIVWPSAVALPPGWARR